MSRRHDETRKDETNGFSFPHGSTLKQKRTADVCKALAARQSCPLTPRMVSEPQAYRRLRSEHVLGALSLEGMTAQTSWQRLAGDQ